MNVVHKITADLNRRDVPSRIEAAQGDSYTRQLQITLTADSAPWPVPDGVTVEVWYRKPDGSSNSYSTLPSGEQAYAIEGNIVTVDLSPVLADTAGLVLLQVVLASNEKSISIFPLQLLVHPVVHSAGTASQ